MQEFMSTRPLSVLTTFLFNAYTFIASLFALPSVHSLLAVQYNFLEMENPGTLSALHRDLTLTAIYLFVSALIPLASNLALYRDSRLGMRVMIGGTVLSVLCAASVRTFPATCVFELGLIFWMAYEIEGFDVLKWAEARVDRARAGRGVEG